MIINEIKKELYKQKPTAYLKGRRKGDYFYICSLENRTTLHFLVPEEEWNGFGDKMEAHLLIRWLSEGMIYKDFRK